MATVEHKADGIAGKAKRSYKKYTKYKTRVTPRQHNNMTDMEREERATQGEREREIGAWAWW